MQWLRSWPLFCRMHRLAVNYLYKSTPYFAQLMKDGLQQSFEPLSFVWSDAVVEDQPGSYHHIMTTGANSVTMPAWPETLRRGYTSPILYAPCLCLVVARTEREHQWPDSPILSETAGADDRVQRTNQACQMYLNLYRAFQSDGRCFTIEYAINTAVLIIFRALQFELIIARVGIPIKR